MNELVKLLEANQWSRRSPSLRIPTCPICQVPEKRGHDEECWLGQAIKLLEKQVANLDTQKVHDGILKQNLEAGLTSVTLETENASLKSHVAGLQVNRDALFEENKRLRAELAQVCIDMNRKTDEHWSNGYAIAKEEDSEVIFQLQTQIKELKSEFEGRMDGANEVIYQLELKKRLAKEARQGLRIELIQMGSVSYFWFLMRDKEVLARSDKIEEKSVIEKEADAVAAQLNLPVIVNERK